MGLGQSSGQQTALSWITALAAASEKAEPLAFDLFLFVLLNWASTPQKPFWWIKFKPAGVVQMSSCNKRRQLHDSEQQALPYHLRTESGVNRLLTRINQQTGTHFQGNGKIVVQDTECFVRNYLMFGKNKGVLSINRFQYCRIIGYSSQVPSTCSTAH